MSADRDEKTCFDVLRDKSIHIRGAEQNITARLESVRTIAEARAVDLSRENDRMPVAPSQHTHLNVDGKVCFCPIGRMYWRYKDQPSWFLKPLRYPKIGVCNSKVA